MLKHNMCTYANYNGQITQFALGNYDYHLYVLPYVFIILNNCHFITPQWLYYISLKNLNRVTIMTLLLFNT